MEDTRVGFTEWGEAAFSRARRTGRPILLWLTTPWCVDCRAMARETFDEPRVAAYLRDEFVPVRVDADRHPRVRERYATGGFPATLVVTPEGRVIAGAGYLGPDELRTLLDRTLSAYEADGESAGTVPAALEASPPGGELSPAVVRHIAGQLTAQWDDAHDGWGTDAKFPLPDTIRFALRHDRSHGVAALDALDRGLIGPDGGVARYARGADWSEPAGERTTLVNAAVLRAFADGYLTTGSERFRGTAGAIVRFLRRELWLDPGFAGSLDREGRRDETQCADTTAAAADALVAYAGYTDDPTARELGEATLDHLRSVFVSGGTVTHVHERSSESNTGEPSAPSGAEPSVSSGAEPSVSNGAEPPVDLLADVAWTVRAFTTAQQVLGSGTDTARRVADRALDRLTGPITEDAASPDGSKNAPTGEQGDAKTDESNPRHVAFRDGPTAGPGLLDRPLWPADEGARLADALVDLSILTGEDRYRERARAAMAALADATERMGVQVAVYGRAVERLRREPLVIAVATPPGSDLHRAALRVADHGKVVVPEADGPPADTARVRGSDAPPAETPAELARAVERRV